MEQKTKPRRPMDPMDRDRQAQAFSDGAGGEEDGQRTPARETYRDGSLISECWHLPE